ncbi:vomeronasal type-1 receptor 4-like [Arvicanthis niloticus]|uniref:vomeronasal type-1 receptor 4-like n=1 Tax=Arvicanthis niloticus TaxID=61156 RepID=UPI001486EB0C|nr:vomeronasal type-1 receptor 4-like [Arvicanthis niloticus]
MDFWNLAIKILFLSQTTTGILGNFSLLLYYVIYYVEHTLKPTDLILMHLMAANALLVLSAGVPQTMVAFDLTQLLNDLGCRLILYIQRVGRSISIGTTCLLSVFQAITISHRESCYKGQKVKAAKYIGCYTSLLWVLHMFINFIFFVDIFIKGNRKNMTRNRDFEYCSIVGKNKFSDSLYAALVVCPEVLSSVLITWSSGSMIVVLYRHKQRVQHIRSFHVSSRNSPESRATQNILVLMSTFLAFYTLSSILQGCIALLHNRNWWLVTITRLTSLCFPTSAPFVLMSHYSFMPRRSLVWIRNETS